jgi:hypothetical protein
MISRGRTSFPREVVEAYRAMAADEQRESEALEWVENLTGEIADEPR